MQAQTRWLRGRGATALALLAALASGMWAWRVALDDYPVSERAERVRTGKRDERISALLELSVLVVSDPSHRHAAVPVAVAATRDRDPLVRAQAVTTLGDITPPSDGELVAMVRRLLSDKLTDSAPQVRHAAAGALGRIGVEVVATRSTLIDLARASDDLTTRIVAIRGLGGLEDADSEVHGVARDALRDSDPSIRAVAVETLAGWLGQKPELALLVLQCMEDSAPGVRLAACRSLESQGAPPLVLMPRLVQLLNHGDAGVSVSAATTLGHMGAGAKEAAPEIWRRQGRVAGGVEANGGWQPAYVLAIAQIAPEGPEAREAMTLLLTLVRDGRPELRPYAALALAEFGPHAAAVIPELRKAEGSADAKLRRAVEISLARIGKADVSTRKSSQ